ncbi:MAG: hypothetical protein LBU32_17135 [Clostridiales bacterium]|nr:hypothetical protein [Clostridiales bacterium]
MSETSARRQGTSSKAPTGENGREFTDPVDAVERAVYFHHPHSSFEKGASERHSGLLRRFVEKGRSAGGMSASLYAKAADWNNNLSRKILGCMSSAEMFEREVLKTAQGAARLLRFHQTSLQRLSEEKHSCGICCI